MTQTTRYNSSPKNDILAQQKEQQMWVVFSGETDFRWLKFLLRRGFRHCYALINDGERWTTFDPLAHKIEIGVHHHVRADFDLPGWLAARGLTIMPVGTPAFKEKSFPPSFFSCVAAVKRLIGVRKMFVFTPYQLFKELKH